MDAILKMKSPTECHDCPCVHETDGVHFCNILNKTNDRQGGKLEDCPIIDIDSEKIKAREFYIKKHIVLCLRNPKMTKEDVIRELTNSIEIIELTNLENFSLSITAIEEHKNPIKTYAEFKEDIKDKEFELPPENSISGYEFDKWIIKNINK